MTNNGVLFRGVCLCVIFGELSENPCLGTSCTAAKHVNVVIRNSITQKAGGLGCHWYM